MTTEAPELPSWTPPSWLNSMMKVMLHTPGLQRVVGQAIALLSFTGRRSGTRYTTPITYLRDGDEVVVITKRFRTWWKNLQDEPQVELRLAGATFAVGRAWRSVSPPACPRWFASWSTISATPRPTASPSPMGTSTKPRPGLSSPIW